jgi:phosphate transport system substrate-binding protein
LIDDEEYVLGLTHHLGEKEGAVRKLVLIVCSVLIIFAGIVAVSNAQTGDRKTTIQVKGADSMANRISMLSRMFMKANTEIDVIVEKGGTVDSGMSELIDKNADVVMASRRITSKEDQAALKKGIQLAERLVGYGGIVIIIHPSNPVNDLTMDQVREIFLGHMRNWKEVGGPNQHINVLRTGDNHPGTLAFLREDVLDGCNLAGKAEVLPSFPAVMKKVATTPGGIGFVRIRDAFESSVAGEAEVKPLKIRQTPALAPVMPSRTTTTNGTYPLRRPYYLYYNAAASNDVVTFADFIAEKGWGSEG